MANAVGELMLAEENGRRGHGADGVHGCWVRSVQIKDGKSDVHAVKDGEQIHHSPDDALHRVKGGDEDGKG